MDKNENGTLRGLHIVLIDRITGEIVAAKVFDTYKSSERLENFIESGTIWENLRKEDCIICIACKDDCT